VHVALISCERIVRATMPPPRIDATPLLAVMGGRDADLPAARLLVTSASLFALKPRARLTRWRCGATVFSAKWASPWWLVGVGSCPYVV